MHAQDRGAINLRVRLEHVLHAGKDTLVLCRIVVRLERTHRNIRLDDQHTFGPVMTDIDGDPRGFDQAGAGEHGRPSFSAASFCSPRRRAILAKSWTAPTRKPRALHPLRSAHEATP